MSETSVVIRLTGAIVSRSIRTATTATVATATTAAASSGSPLPTAEIATSPPSAANSPCARLMTPLTVKTATKPMAMSA